MKVRSGETSVEDREYEYWSKNLTNFRFLFMLLNHPVLMDISHHGSLKTLCKAYKYIYIYIYIIIP